MKRITIFTALFILSFFSLFSANPGLEDIIVEAIPVDSGIAASNDSLSSDAVVYRIFVDMKPGYGLSVITGTLATLEDPTYPLSISTTTSFFNSQYGAGKGDELNPAFVAIDPTLVYDSYICVGGVMDGRIGVPVFLDSNGYVSGTPVETLNTPGLNISMFGTENSTNDFYTEDGSWNGVVTGGVKGPAQTDSTIVLIGQFTTDGILSFALNIQLRDPLNTFTQYFTATGRWYNHGGNKPVIQFTRLNNIYGPGIEHPEVSIVSPSDTVIKKGDSIKFVANASDPDGTIDSVEFRMNTIKVGVDVSPPYEYTFVSTRKRVYEVTAIAVDNDGASTLSDSIMLNVVLDVPKKPLTEFISPENGDLIKKDSTVQVLVKATDLDDYVDSVEFFVNNIKLGVDTVINDTARFNWLCDSVGTFNLQVKATDSSGMSSSETITVTVVIGFPPEANLIVLSHTDTIPRGDTVTFAVNATDTDGTISKVEFFVEEVSIGFDSTLPYQVKWVAENTGKFTVIAEATDNEENIAESNQLNIIVSDNTQIIHPGVNETIIHAFPNPTNGIIHIKVNTKKTTKKALYNVYNMQGIKICSGIINTGQIQHETIDLSEYPRGIYHFTIHNGSSIMNKTIIKK